MGNMTEQVVEQAKRALETASAELQKASTAHDVEAKRLAVARDQVAELDQELATLDPDGDAFDRLVARKGKAGARAEALAIREQKTRAELASAREVLKEAELAKTRADVAQANEKIAMKEAGLDALVRELAARLVAGVRELGPLVGARNGLEERLPLDPGLPYHIHRRHSWDLGAVGHITAEAAMRAAMGVTLLVTRFEKAREQSCPLARGGGLHAEPSPLSPRTGTAAA
jgi:hypothetical protein